MVGKLCNKLTMTDLSKAVQEDRAKEEMAKDGTGSPKKTLTFQTLNILIAEREIYFVSQL